MSDKLQASPSGIAHPAPPQLLAKVPVIRPAAKAGLASKGVLSLLEVFVTGCLRDARPSPFVCLVVASACAVCIATTALAQDPPPATEPDPVFEVASVKKSGPMPSGAFRFGMQPNGRFSVTQMTLNNLITLAYGIQRYQLVGGPGWINTDRFDINAKSEDGAAMRPPAPGVPNRMQLMLRALLKERFMLAVHTETRELPVSYLVVARDDGKLGAGLRASTDRLRKASGRTR